jgi:hypothetical protein
MELTESFFVFFVSSIIALLGVSLRTIYKSKCVRFSCCGITVERDTQAEEQVDLRRPEEEAKN